MTPTRHSLRSPRRRAGLTIAELVISSAATAILIAGMASAIVLATRALPDNAGDLDQLVSASATAEQITGELSCATALLTNTDHAIEFTLPDQDSDGQPETIRYEWSAAPSAPLQRQYNGGAPVVVLDDVAAFDLRYDALEFTRQQPASETTSAEVLLASHDSTSDLADVKVTASLWPAQHFVPTLPADAVRWRVTRILLRAAVEGSATGVARVQLRTGDSSLCPTSTVLAETPLYESSLPSSYQWCEFAFAGAPELSASDGVCLVAQYVSGTDAGKLQYQTKNVAVPSFARSASTDSGASWQLFANQALLFYAYGTITTSAPGPLGVLHEVTAVHLTLRAGQNSTNAVETAVQLLNRPEVGG